MVSFNLLLLLCSGAGLVFSQPDSAPVVVESLHGVPRGWTQVRQPIPWARDTDDEHFVQISEASPSDVLVLRLAMVQPLLADFHQLVQNISTPGHPSYGDYLTQRDVDVWTQPSSEASDQITAWLKSEGVDADTIKLAGHIITFNVTVSTADALLDTRFYYYRQKDTTVIRTLQYSMPSRLRNMMETIQPTTRFGSPKAQINWDTNDKPLQIDSTTLTTYNETFCNTTVTPACIRGLYHMSNFTPSTNAMSLGISGFDGQVFYVNDLNIFASNLDPSLTGSINISSINGGIAHAGYTVNTSAEGNLDVSQCA